MSPRRSSPASRATRRSRRPPPRRTTFVERNRTRLLVAAGTIGFLILAAFAFWSSTQPAYACTRLFDPTPAPSFVAPSPAAVASGESPAPAVTPPPPGYVQPDMGHLHVNTGTKVTYTSCPPASGKHYNASGEGPIRPGVYGPDDKTIPDGWVHNLEHAALVVLYRCPEGVGPGCTDEAQAAMEALYPKIPASPICHVPAAQLHVITRFDDMAWPYAAVVWDVVLPLETLDEAAILDFYARQGDRFNPEDPATCVQPTPTPGPATPTQAPSPAASPAASLAASPAETPAASAAPAS